MTEAYFRAVFIGCCCLVIGTLVFSSVYLDTSSWKARFLTVVDESMTKLYSSHSGQYQRQTNKTILIITWTNLYGNYAPWFREGTKMFEKCELPEGVMCEYAHDRSLYDSADAIMFKGDRINEYDMPIDRRTYQLWIFYEWETFQHRTGNRWRKVATAFNITSAYSSQADITNPYGYCRKKTINETNDTPKIQNYAANKPKFASWMVGNCNPASHRQEYIYELQKHIPLDIFGKCGNLTCTNCMAELQKYKFYLAFENSYCGDYVTEKFYRTLMVNTVPVVLGLADYRRLAPPHSYIDIRDFRSPKHLADYLHMLDKNDDLYNEYFRWKPFYLCKALPLFVERELCDTCRLVHKRLNSPPIIPFNVSRIYEGSAQCHPTEDFKKTCDCWPKNSSDMPFRFWPARPHTL